MVFVLYSTPKISEWLQMSLHIKVILHAFGLLHKMF